MRRSGLIVGALLLLVTSVGAGFIVQNRGPRDAARLFAQVFQHIERNAVEPLDRNAIYEMATRGLIEQLDDPYAALYSPEEIARFSREQVGSAYGGLGMQIEDQRGVATVTRVFPNSPAERGAVRPGDRIVEIDGEPTRGLKLEEVSSRLLGRPGTEVEVTFVRAGVDEPIRGRFTRAIIHIPAVPFAILLDDGVGYIPLQRFNENAGEEVAQAVRSLRRQGASAFIIDLRGNSGGSLDAAVDISDLFLQRGQTIVTVRYRNQPTDEYRARGRTVVGDEPIVVLVDGYSASASEIVAGALQDHDRALIVGQPTFGKSLMMQAFPMTDGSVFVLVVGHVRTPCGRNIQREYRSVTTREYYRASREERDRAGRPTCTTAGGRTVYGGGGIYPDVLLERREIPLWLAQVREAMLPLRWTPGYIEANADRFPDPESLARAPRLPPDAIPLFREFAREQGIRIPEGEDADRRLEELLLLSIAAARWGPSGYSRVAAAIDPEVAAAVAAFDTAQMVLGVRN